MQRHRTAITELLNVFRFPSPDWLVGLVTDVEAPPLELNDVSFLQVLQTGITQHHLLRLEIKKCQHINKIKTEICTKGKYFILNPPQVGDTGKDAPKLNVT